MACRSYHRRWLLGAVALAVLATDTASAQVAPTAISEIVVTARKRTEDLRNVPLAIDVLSADTIARRGIATTNDIAQATTGVTYDLGAFPNDTRPAIRGMQAERGRPSVAVLIDGFDLSGENLGGVAGGTAALNTRLFDLERIEVVKGPQSVLYGRSAFSGAINYVTKPPSFEPEGKVNFGFAQGGMSDLRAGISGPVVAEKLALRLNAARYQDHGRYRNAVTGDRLGKDKSVGVAGGLLWKPSEAIDVQLRFQHTDDDTGDAPAALLVANTRVPAPGASFRTSGTAPSSPCPANVSGLPAVIAQQCTRATFEGAIDANESQLQASRNFFGSYPYGSRQKQNLATLETNWRTGFGTFTWVAGAVSITNDIEIDGDFSSSPAPRPDFANPNLSLDVYQLIYNRNRRQSQELRWSETFGKLRVLAGAQLFTESAKYINAGQFWLRFPTSAILPPALSSLLRAPLSQARFPVTQRRNTDYYGVFGGLYYEVTDRFRVSAEARYNHDRIKYRLPGYSVELVTLRRNFISCPGPALPPSGPGGPIGAAFCPREQVGELNYDQVTPRFTAEYRFGEDVFVYGVFAQGFKPGGVNTNETVLLTANQIYDREKVDTYELGFKGRYLDGRLSTNIAAYWNDYKDQQVGVQIQTELGLANAGTVNAARVRIRGIEFDAEYRVADPLTLRIAYAFTDARFIDFKQGPPSGSTVNCGTPPGQFSSDLNRAEAGNVCGDLSGNVPGRSPRHAVNFDVQYRQPVSSALEGFIEATSQFRSKRFLDETNAATLDSYWLFGLRAGVDGEKWSLWAFVDNLFDNDKIQTAQKFVDYANPDGFAPSRGVLAYLPEPRTIGVRGEVRF